MAWIIQLLASVVIPVVALKIYDAVYMTDYFKGAHIYFHEPGPCHLVDGTEQGSEDVQVMSDGIALITSGLKFGGDHPTTRNRKGRILMFDFKKKTGVATEVSVEGNLNMETFHPHGISLWEDDRTGEVTVFVINHATDTTEDSVEKFTFDRERKVLRHVASITSPAFKVMNDLVAASSSTFYATNYFYTKTTGFWEKTLRLRWGSVVFFDGQDGQLVVSSLGGPNGINISPDGKTLYVASFWDEQMLLYTKYPNNSLSLKGAMDLYTRPDNINIDKNTGDIWIGTHPIYHRLNEHHADPLAIPTPSQVLRIRRGSDVIEEIYSEDGVRLYGSSVAERYGDSILIGTVSHKLLHCELKHIP